jgi:glutathione S-transferase
LKGRPPGTKKSTDPEKKKRKRVARERDLCDVKIKITEYFDQDEYEEQLGHRPPGADMKASTSPVAADAQRFSASYSSQNQQFFGQTQMMPQRSVDAWGMPSVDPPGTKMHQFTAGSDMSNLTMSGTPPKKYYTFQRVNGNGGNGKGDGVAGPHKHTLEDSDRVKKNSVIRWLAKCEKDGRGKSQVRLVRYVVSLRNLVARYALGFFPTLCRRSSVVPVVCHVHHVILMRLLASSITRELSDTSSTYSTHSPMYVIPRALSTSSRCFLLTIPTSTARHLLFSRLPSRPPSDQVPSRSTMTDTNQGGDPSKKTYHKKATGNALTTVKNHSKDDDLKIYGSAFWYVTIPFMTPFFPPTTTDPSHSPFVQRVWISLEHKHIPYQYIEVDPYKKPQSLLDVNPRGLVPALRHGPTWSTHESTVIMEYLEDLNTGPALFPPDAQARATSRLWTDHINRHIIPLFYKLLQAQDTADQVTHAKEFRDQINKLVAAADPTGPFFLGPHMSFVDVQIAPWIVRLRRVLGQYRGWPEAEEGSRWKAWIDAVEAEESVRMTTSSDELYLDSYERYAENRPGTSQVADAVNRGGGLP